MMKNDLLTAISSDCIDVNISFHEIDELMLGRGPITGIKDTKCSRNQVKLRFDNVSKMTYISRIGSNISKLNDVALEVDEEQLLRDGDIISLLFDDFKYRYKSENSSGKIMRSPAKDSINMKQTSLSNFMKKIPNNKRKSKESLSDDDEREKELEVKLKKLKHELDDKESFDDSKSEQAKDKISQSESTWEEYDGLLLFNSKGVKPSSKIASFDIDKTIIRTKSGREFPIKTDDWQINLPEVPKKLQKLVVDGYKLVFFSNQKSLGKNQSLVKDFKKKIENIVKLLKVPVQVFLSTGTGLYRKPAPGMWTYLEKYANNGMEIDINDSYYVGDAAGRPAKFLPGKKKDFACSDRLFAMNVGFKFYTPEEFFLGHKPFTFTLPDFNPKTLLSKELLEPPDAKLTSDSLEVIVMVGMQASGKSHFSNSYLVPNGYGYVNRDTLGSWQKCVSKCQSFLANGTSVVIDNTNPDKESRKRYINCAKTANAKCRCFFLDVTVEQARHNNAFRQIIDVNKTHAHVSNVILYSFRKNLVKPKVEEGFDEVVGVNFIPKFGSIEDEKLYSMFLVEK